MAKPSPPCAMTQALLERRWPELAQSLGWDTERAHALPIESLGAWGVEPQHLHDAKLWMLGAHNGHRLILVQGLHDPLARRQLVTGSYHFNRARVLVWWFVHDDELTVALPDRGADAAPLIRSLSISLTHPSALLLDRLKALAWSQVVPDPMHEPGEALRSHWRGVLGQGELTSKFYRRFMGLHAKLAGAMRHGPTALAERRLLAMTIMLRLVVLCFLQRAGALDQDRHYLLRARSRAQQQGLDFYQDLLHPLCFGALNCPLDERQAHISALGRLPFLNGGLFEPLPLELEHLRLSWPEPIWAELIDDFLESYRFTLFEPAAQDQPWAISPEVLGRVFESLMWPERRKATGAFYSPPELVRELVERSLRAQLERQAELSPSQAQALLEGDAQELDPEQRTQALAALANLRILDPAVGTGAFLVEALHQLSRARQAVGDGPSPGQSRWRWLSSLIHQHLHGVDIDPMAVRLCEVRLWLVLLATCLDPEHPPELIEPLPNLSHRIVEGDSLISAWSELISDDPSRALNSQWPRPDHWHKLVAAHAQAQDDYLNAHGEPKRAARRARAAAERALATGLLDTKLERLRASLKTITKLTQSVDLFGQPTQLTAAQHKHKLSVERDIKALEALRAQTSKQLHSPMAFAYALRFSDVMAQGGFDLILTNPPWVRATKQETPSKSLYTQRFMTANTALWPQADSQGVSTTFGAQVDLSAMFIERALELIRPGGLITAIFPAKLLRSLQGGALRQLIMAQELLYLEDRSDADASIFDAVTYPAAMLLRRSQDPLALEPEPPSDQAPLLDATPSPRLATSPHEEHEAELVVWSGQLPLRWSQPQGDLSLGEHAAYPWLLLYPEDASSLRALWLAHKPLGHFDALRPRRGVMTGKNDAFILDAFAMRRMLGPDAERYSRPVVAGRDIDQGQLQYDKRIIWPYDDALNLRSSLPSPLLVHLEAWRDALQKRSDHSPHKPLWQLFRVQEGLNTPKVIWADMGQTLRVALAGAQVIPLNTTYYIPFTDDVRAWTMAQVLASPIAQRFCNACAERARGGWRRHLAWVINLLPVPERLGRWLGQESQDPQLGALWATLFKAQDQVQAQEVLRAMYKHQIPLALEPALTAPFKTIGDEPSAPGGR